MSKTDFFVKNFGNRHEAKKKIISILLANLLAAVAIDFFFSQKNFLSGGSTGIGLLVQYMTGIPTGVTVFLLNIPIMIIGYKYLTRQFVNYAAISTIVLSVYLTLFHYLPNPFILKDDMLVAVVGGAINGTSMGTLFRFGTCSGGLDIIAAIMKNEKDISIGNVLMACNAVILAIGSALYGIDKGFYTIISMFVAYRVLDKIELGIGETKQVFVITSKNEEVANIIMQDMNRGVTFLHGEGAYLNNDQDIIFCVLKRAQVAYLKKKLKKIDPRAFITVNDAYEVLGKGFEREEY